MEPKIVSRPSSDDRVRATENLAVAERNPVLSDTQSCGVAHVYALLAIEQRLAQICSSLDAALTALVDLSHSVDATVVGAPSLAS